jgi:tetratricopeptide (TPR) repeat protein
MKQIAILLIAVHTAFAQPEAARDISNQGLDAYNRRDIAAAERLDREAIAKWEALGAGYAPHLGVTRMNLGLVLSVEGRRAEALSELRHAVALLRGALGVRSMQALIAVNLLAGLDLALGYDAAASELLNEALPIARQIDPEGIQSVRVLVGFAGLRIRDGRFDEAQSFADEALRIAIHADGEDGVDTALAYSTAAEAHRVAGRPERALPLYRRARAIYEKRLGPDDTRVAAVLSQEAAVLISDRQFVTAEQELKRSLGILDRVCPACTLERWNAESAFALLRTRQGKYAEADRLFSHILALQEAAQPRPSGALAETLNSLAFVRRKERLFDDADRLTRRAATLSFR